MCAFPVVWSYCSVILLGPMFNESVNLGIYAHQGSVVQMRNMKKKRYFQKEKNGLIFTNIEMQNIANSLLSN